MTSPKELKYCPCKRPQRSASAAAAATAAAAVRRQQSLFLTQLIILLPWSAAVAVVGSGSSTLGREREIPVPRPPFLSAPARLPACLPPSLSALVSGSPRVGLGFVKMCLRHLAAAKKYVTNGRTIQSCSVYEPPPNFYCLQTSAAS